MGSTSYITNLDGDVVQHIEYIPFGEVFLEERNNKWNTPYLFNAKELDEETGLYYYGVRYYDPRVSLWLGIDPMQEKYPNISTYAYTNNNPIKYIDPTGMEGEDGDPNKNKASNNGFKIESNSGNFLSKVKDSVLRYIGLHPDQMHPDNADSSSPKALEESTRIYEEGRANRQVTLETLDAINETMLMVIPFGEAGYKVYRNKKVSKSDIGLELLGVVPFGKIVTKSGKITTTLVKIITKEDDVMIFATKFGDEIVEGIANFRVKENKLFLDKLHLQGSEGGKIGISNLFETARDLGRQHGVEEVVIQGGKRTTGKYKGTVPSPITIKVNQ